MKKLISAFAALCLIWILALPVLAADSPYIYDEANLLTDLEEQALLTTIESVARTYDCGVYVVTVEDFWQYGDSPYSAAVALYVDRIPLGGASDNGILLMLSMRERDYSIITYGDGAEAVFTDRDLTRMEEAFLDCFRYDLWYDGFACYVSDCAAEWEKGAAGGSVLDAAAEEVYYRVSYYPDGMWMLVAGGSCVIALIICLVMRAGMRTARISSTASEYIPAGGVNLRVKQDRFTHTTKQVIHHPKSSGSSGGGSIGGGGGGGFRGHSGKF